MAWSIFTDGGGQAAAEKWAEDLCSMLGVPASMSRVIYDWEVSEGGGGIWNPLNQGDVPGHPELTTSGSQFGGGAANYGSRQDGLQGAYDYIHMPNYVHVLAALRAGDEAAVRSAIVLSPWAASHYGGGRAFSNSPLPFPNPASGADLTPDQATKLDTIFTFITSQQDQVNGGAPWDLTQILNDVRIMQADIASIKAKVGA